MALTVLKTDETKSVNLVADLIEQIVRVSKIVDVYSEIPAGRLAAALMKNDLNDAKQAISDGDVVAMIRLFNALKTYEL